MSQPNRKRVVKHVVQPLSAKKILATYNPTQSEVQEVSEALVAVGLAPALQRYRGLPRGLFIRQGAKAKHRTH
jgi:hypothetical protein